MEFILTSLSNSAVGSIVYTCHCFLILHASELVH